MVLNSPHGIQRKGCAIEATDRGRRSPAYCSPSSCAVFFQQVPIVDVVMNGQQLDGRDAQRLQMPDRRLGSQAGKTPAQLFGNFWMQLSEAFDVQLVDRGLDQGVFGGRSSPQVKAGSITAASGARPHYRDRRTTGPPALSPNL